MAQVDILEGIGRFQGLSSVVFLSKVRHNENITNTWKI